MATRGARPKPANLRVVEGTHRKDRHGKEPEVAVSTESSPLPKPDFLTGNASAAWDRWIAPAFWLEWTRESAAIAFCFLWSEFRDSPDKFQSARHAQMRAYMSELGLTDERNRKTGDDGEKEDPADQYFD